MIYSRCLCHTQVIFLLQAIVLGGLLQALPPATSQAQEAPPIRPDGTLGTTVTQNGNVFDIDGGTIRGSSQFQSFDVFSVPTEITASFNGPSGITNILSRVTGLQSGLQQSVIDGTIQSAIPGANLFLMNPAGIVFGSTASLNVSGAVHFTTADHLRLADNVQFAAVPGPSDAVLSVARVVSFGFLGPNPAKITVDQSVLEVPEGETLSIVAGDIEIVGDGSFTNAILRARNGQVNIASVASAGEVIPSAPGESPGLQVDSFERLGSLTLANEALVDATGDSGGTVIIRGGRLMIDSSSVFVDTEGGLDGAPLGIDIDVAGDVNVTNGFITTDVFGAGDAGGIRIKADNMHLIGEPNNDPDDSSARIGSLAFGSGATGSVEVMTTNSLVMEGRAEITTSTNGPGNAGNIDLKARNVSISGTSNEEATGGIAANTFGGGAGGRVQITADNLELANQGRIQSGTEGTGDGGGVNIDLTGNLELREGSFILGDSDAAGKATDINITAQDINITGIRDASDPDAFGVFTGIDSSAQDTGSGGNVNIMAENLRLTDNATISTSSTDIGSNAGSISIKVSDSILIENGTVTTEAEQADGGNITLMAPDTIRLSNSQINTSVGGGPTTVGGNINIDPQFVILKNSQIVANAFQGQGGNINITAGALLADPTSVIDASSDFGIDGNVEINSPDINIIEGTLELPASFLNVQSLLSTRCASRTTKPVSSFFVTNGGLPLGPDTLIPAGVTGVGINSGGSDSPQSDHSDEIPELLVRTSAFGGCTGAIE